MFENNQKNLNISTANISVAIVNVTSCLLWVVFCLILSFEIDIFIYLISTFVVGGLVWIVVYFKLKKISGITEEE